MSAPLPAAALLDLLIEHSRTAAVVLDDTGRLIIATARWLAVMRGPEDLSPGDPLETLLPSMPPAAMARLRTVCAGNQPGTTVRLTDASGTPFWLIATALTATDASGRYDLPVALLERVDEVDWYRAHPDHGTSLLNAALDATTDGLLVVDRRGSVVRANKRFFEMWRVPPQMAAERSDAKLLEHALPQLIDPEGFVARVRQLCERPEEESADTIRFHDGRVFERYSSPQRVRGLVVGRVWSFRDVTARVRAEHDRDRLDSELRQHAKLESLATMAGGIAHDFNNLLLQVIGHSQILLADMPVRSPYRQRVQQTHDAAERAARLTSQMLTYAGQVNAILTDVDPVVVVRDLEAELRGSLPDGSTLSVHCARTPDIRGDARLLREALQMLAGNAREALGPGGQLRIGVEPIDATRDVLRTCYFSALRPGQAVQITVHDTGHGMDERTLGRAFDPFFSTRFQGRGLGLSFVLGIVRAHQGAIALESAAGQGTTVRLLLPTAQE